MKARDYYLKESMISESLVGDSVKFDKMVKQIADLTDDNAHTEALMVLAKHLRMKNVEKVLLGIQTIHNALGHMPTTLITFRTEMSDEIMKYAERELEPVQFKKIKDVL